MLKSDVMKLDQNFNPTDDLRRKNSRNRRKKTVRRILFFAIFVLFVALGMWIFAISGNLRDQITAWQNPLDEKIAKLSDDAGLNSRGKFLLQVSKAQLNNRDDFNKNCENNGESQSIVLGCFAKNRIYVFDVSDAQISEIKSVIAAHEMLHAAYARLSDGEKTKIDAEIREFIPKIQNAEIKNSLKIYEKTEPGEEINELHSLLATEEKTLPENLENYYKKYFADREKVVENYEKYAAVFAKIENEQDEISRKMAELKSGIDAASEKYRENSRNLTAEIDEFNNCARTENCFANEEDFAKKRAELLAKQTELKNLENSVNSEIDEYNSDAEKLNSLGEKAQKITESLDSRAAEIE